VYLSDDGQLERLFCSTDGVRREERERILRQGVVSVETPRERRQRTGLAEDVASSPLRGRRLPLRLRNFVPTTDAYLASLGGPLPYMVRLREIEAATREHTERLEDAWRLLAHECDDGRVFSARWRETVERWSFDEVNDLIARHNRWYPAESRLPMDPRTGDFALVNGRGYQRALLDAGWALRRFPPSLTAARAA
jgi:hypothetical protein